MTKLEEKLIELGYAYVGHYYYSKRFDDSLAIVLQLVDFMDYDGKVKPAFYVAQVNIIDLPICVDKTDNLQQAYNQLQNDLEVLKEYDNK